MTQSTRSTSPRRFALVTGVWKRGEQPPPRHRAARRPRSDLDLLAEHFPALAQHTAAPPAPYRASDATPADVTAPAELAHRTTARMVPVPGPSTEATTAVLPRVTAPVPPAPQPMPLTIEQMQVVEAVADPQHWREAVAAAARLLLRRGPEAVHPLLLADALRVREAEHPTELIAGTHEVRAANAAVGRDRMLAWLPFAADRAAERASMEAVRRREFDDADRARFERDVAAVLAAARTGAVAS